MESYTWRLARAHHQVVAARLTALLVVHTESRALGTVVPDTDLIIDDRDTYVSPDIMFFNTERYAAVNPDQFIRVVPNLIVEVVSPSSELYDPRTKRDLYARLGVPRYWIANPRMRSIQENVLGADGRYQSRTIRAPDVFVPTLFPDLQIDLARVFA